MFEQGNKDPAVSCLPDVTVTSPPHQAATIWMARRDPDKYPAQFMDPRFPDISGLPLYVCNKRMLRSRISANSKFPEPFFFGTVAMHGNVFN
jgi:hypothetical protein